mmetsp:Transcript_17275/g.21110  ORF Transcript_17275/g.21110 Transcript_17275/m.21110 type:complete len:579 (+) Transcript_17275:69-1805(+)
MYTNTTAELSLNTPSKSLTSVPNDTTNHRFLIGTCALSTSNSSSSQTPSSSSFPPSSPMGGNPPTNSLYLIRYHEEMNELAVDAQLCFDDGNSGESGGGEIWSLSSCPMDKTLLVACQQDTHTAETALWRIPENAMREDELDYYPDDDDYGRDSGNNHSSGGLNNIGISRNASDTLMKNYSCEMNKTLEKIESLHTENKDASNNHNMAVIKGRVSDMTWNPECMPNADEFGTDIGTSAAGGINFLTVNFTLQGNPTLTTWDMNTSAAIPVHHLSIPTSRIAIGNPIIPNPSKVSWDPHNTNLCALTIGMNVGIIDLRSGHIVSGLKSCHKFGVSDLDHNPNKPNVLSTCGLDALVKFWDLRYTSSSSSSAFDDHHLEAVQNEELVPSSPSSNLSASANWMRQQPLRILRGGHTHWTTKVKYNKFHDQLLLSGGTDGMVNLWRVSSISSAPLLDLGSTTDENHGNHRDNMNLMTSLSGFDDEFEEQKARLGLNDSVDYDDPVYGLGYNNQNLERSGDGGRLFEDGGNAPDTRVTKMEMRDAVYDIDWSAADPWIYVSLGSDGNVVLNHVPSKEKYKILL